MREYATEWWFVVTLVLTSVSALPGETLTPEIVFSVMLGIRWDHPRRRIEILHGGWSLGGSSEVRILSKSVKRFRGCEGRNLPFPTDLAKSVAKG